MSIDQRKPISWYPCPFCGVAAHKVCRPKGWPAHDHDRRYYPIGHYHAARERLAHNDGPESEA